MRLKRGAGGDFWVDVEAILTWAFGLSARRSTFVFINITQSEAVILIPFESVNALASV